jgi:cytoskeletal protein CcmA (bactofilin family)
MADPTVIGRATFVRGRLAGSGDIEIAGRVEGDVASDGEVTVEAGGLKGDLVAEDALVIEAGAKVVGDLRAPRIAIAQGGLVRGHVQTGAAGAARPRAQSAAAARPAPAKVAAPAPKAAPVAAKSAANGPSRATPPRGATLAGSRMGPPPPVVPALKKGTKAVQKKR